MAAAAGKEDYAALPSGSPRVAGGATGSCVRRDGVVQFPEPCDTLPSMVEWMERLNRRRRLQRGLFEKRGESGWEDVKNREMDQQVMLAVFLGLLEGATRLERATAALRSCWRKADVIRTANAMEEVIRRAPVTDPMGFLDGEFGCYTRQHTALAAGAPLSRESRAMTGTVLKCYQLLFVMLVSGRPWTTRGLCYAPPRDIFNTLSFRTQKSKALAERVDLGELVACSIPIDIVEFTGEPYLPMHPEWLSHNVPLIESRMFEEWLRVLQANLEEDPTHLAGRLASYRLALATILGVLRGQIDFATRLQNFMLTLTAVSFLAALMYVWRPVAQCPDSR